MKKNIFTGTLFIICFLAIVGLVGGYESKYSKIAICTNYVNDVYIFTDLSGNNWEWKKGPTDCFKIDSTYKLIMDNNHTSSNYDDWIYKIKEN